MAGIYIHVPFCKSRCIYCGFFSTTSLSRRDDYVRAVCQELKLRRACLAGQPVETIYFGGGTPSQLSLHHVAQILETIYSIYNVRAREITLECNPDDATEHLHDLRTLGVNRLSMGVQTFDEARLRFLRRRHTAAQAAAAVRKAQEAGFENISLDLMFGFPGQSLADWKQDVAKALSLDVQHLSAYSLMYEEGTPLERLLAQGKVEELDEDISLAMYEHLLDATAAAGFEHYEISNFSLLGMRSQHNSAYWQGTPYLGVGAGAHSYDGETRTCCPDSLDGYLENVLTRGVVPLEREVLTPAERYNEYVFTALRTCDGLDTSELCRRFGQRLHDYCLENTQRHIQQGRLLRVGNRLRLSRKGLFVSNDVMSDLMWTD